ncbi:MAG: hypothetical protein SFU56_03995 [Capsulimonadales bacterium]|nr:hypothetical protein [Capsulimonadales bacterium]
MLLLLSRRLRLLRTDGLLRWRRLHLLVWVRLLRQRRGEKGVGPNPMFFSRYMTGAAAAALLLSAAPAARAQEQEKPPTAAAPDRAQDQRQRLRSTLPP